jgi:hypothetical protein
MKSPGQTGTGAKSDVLCLVTRLFSQNTQRVSTDGIA